jgi:hypothetical protein
MTATADGADRSGESVANPARAEPAASVLPERIGERYRVLSELGRGGMAVVYRVVDTIDSRELALKQLTLPTGERFFREQAAAFEREYHTLVQLSHPRIIEVYDFGNDPGGRYYTMELLEGADLRERSPLPWREACSLLYDVTSSLALLHSRRLVHRDISPRNVRSTRDGTAKLIDFGALVPMGATGQIVGTPPFLPPEVLHRSTLDARTDLFSLGATLYYTLTGRFAYAARDFSRLQQAWAKRPAPPSAVVPGIPGALDALVMSLLSLDPDLRPRTAFDVMQRLAALAGIERKEVEEVSQAYVSTPVMVGRDQALALVRERIALALAGHKSGLLVQGPPGIGRTRMLDVSALEAKIAGAAVLRVNAGSQTNASLCVGQALAAEVVEALPRLAVASAHRERVTEILFEPSEPDVAPIAKGFERAPRLKSLVGRGGDRAAIQSALTRFLLRVAKTQPLAILIDDVHRADEASLALLAALLLGDKERRLLLLVTAETGASVPKVDAFNLLERECAQLELPALSAEQIEALLSSVFGDVPNLALVSDRLYSAGAGNPRETMELVQQLIARGAARYASGQWQLPARLEAAELASTAVESCKRRVGELSPVARLLAEVHALALHKQLSREDYARAASDVPSAELDAAITELLAQRVLASDGRVYLLSRREWPEVLLADLDAQALAARHRMLAAVYANDDAHGIERTHHLLAGDRESDGVDLLMKLLAGTRADSNGVLSLTSMTAESVALVLDRALTCAEKLGRKPHETTEIRRGLFAISIICEEAHYARAAPAWLARLKRDSGLAHYEAITDAANPGERLMRALTLASEQHAATPEDERVYTAQEAIRNLVYFVAISIAIATRTQDSALLILLPSLLEPFAALSPLIHAMWQNAIAARETARDNRPESALKRWLEVDAALCKISSTELNYVAALRGAIAYGVGLIEARLGFTSAEQRARALEDDPFQRVSSASLRRIARLHQGDFAGAERFRRRGELLALQSNQRPMFQSTLTAELIAYALASDLTGIRQLADAIEPLSARFPGWLGYKHLAQGYFEQARGQFDSARVAFERGLAVAEPDPRDLNRCFGCWPRLEGAYVEVLVSLNRAADAKARGERALQICAESGIDAVAFVIRRALALAEAKLGDYAGASRRLEGVIADLQALGITGLELGATYEARTRIAIWANDHAAIEAYGRLTAKEYRHGERSPLGARYERLMDEARSSGVFVLPELTEFQTKVTTSNWRSPENVATTASKPLASMHGASERMERALRLLCEGRDARSGQLYLCRPGGLQLVAWQGQDPPGPELRESAERFIAQQLSADDFATVVDGGQAPPPTASAWLDTRGVTHQFVLLTGTRGAERVCVGVAVIESSINTGVDRHARQLLDELACELLTRGDASGIAEG